jgi:hypothetical protein
VTELLDLVPRMAQAGGTTPPDEILLRVTALLLAAMLVAIGLRRSSAALRHLVWALSLVGSLLIPLFSWALPAWELAILPQRQQAAPPSLTAVVEDSSTAVPFPAGYSSDARPSEPFDLAAVLPVTAAKHSAAVERASASSAAPAVVAARHVWSWSAVLAVLWAVGAALGFVWLTVGIASAWRVVRGAQPAADSRWQSLLRQLLDQCGARRPVEVRQRAGLTVPMT